MDQTDLGERVGCSQRWVSMIEVGRRQPSVALCRRMEEVLGVRLDRGATDAGDDDGPRTLALRTRDGELSRTISAAWTEREQVRRELAGVSA